MGAGKAGQGLELRKRNRDQGLINQKYKLENIMIIIKNIKLTYIVTLILVFMFCSVELFTVFAHDEIENRFGNSSSLTMDFEDELAWLREENYVNIATKNPIEMSKAPSIVTVITAEEIENIGAKTLPDIIRTVPGFDIIKDGDFGEIKIQARGVASIGSKIKLLIDGHSLNMPYDGAFEFFFDDLPLKNVKKIEIIRGPGSALYGANAFLAIINVVTKDASDIDGVKVATGFGTYDTQEYSVSFGKTFRDIDITGFADFYNTNGLSETIKEDQMARQPFSITPGDTDDSRNKLDFYLKSTYKNINFIGKYMNKDTEPFVGSSFILTEDGENKFNFVMGEVNYKFDVGERLSVKPRVYYDQYDMDFLVEQFPDGFVMSSDLDGDGDIEEFPNGKIAQGLATNRRLGAEIQMDYDISENNTFTLGFDYKWERQDNVTHHANFNPINNASLGSIQDVVDWIGEAYRQIWAIYIQDMWNISDNIDLTIGIRHDHYSDFEGTTNPRIGLVWDFMDDFTLKLLYGQAFRAPSLKELYLISNPTLLGNPDLQPETIRTYEVGLGHKFNKRIVANVNYFFNVIRDEIVMVFSNAPTVAGVFENMGGSNIQGIEFETKADLSDYWSDAYIFVNYTYQDAESKGDPLPDVPKHKGNIGINAGITKYLNANLHTFISDDRVRAEKDTRSDSPGYAITNLTLIAKDFFKDMKVKASLFNLFDKKYDDPAPANTISTDLPRQGRTFFIEVEYKF